MGATNAIVTDSGIEVYASDIDIYASDYISSLDDKDTIKRNPIFKGMLKYIYTNLFKPHKGINKYNSNLDYGDIDLIDGIWDIYTALCYRHSQYPTLLNFSLLTGISMDCFNDWRNDTNRGYVYYTLDGDRIKDFPAWRVNHREAEYRQEASNSHSQTVKKWLKECEASAYDVALSGNPGGMFILKANYGYTEAPQQIQVMGDVNQVSRDEIAARAQIVGLPPASVADLPD